MSVSENVVVLDIGNSNIVIGIYSKFKLLASWRVSSYLNYGNDDYYALLHGLIGDGLKKMSVINALFCSVVPQLTTTIYDSLKKLGCLKIVELRNDLDLGLQIKPGTLKNLGTDRLANAYAAFIKYKKSLIVIDYGTATTFDVVTSAGQYLGGLITTGLKISADALVNKTSQLPKIELAAPTKVIGDNTISSMQSGLVIGYAAMSDGLVERINHECGKNNLVIATGGLAKIMHKVCKRIDYFDPELTIWGLANIYYNFFKS